MKRAAILAIVVLAAVAALVVSQRRKAETAVGPQGALNVAADVGREVSRVPMRATRLSDADEIRIGDELARQYGGMLAGSGAPDAEKLVMQAYVDEVGAKLAARAHRKLPWKFHYVADRGFVNAFALPGGHIYIGSGLIELMDSEDQLASVLAHEIEHVDHHHSAERVQIEARMRNLNLDVVGALVSVPVAVFQAGYSKQQEFEADREGLKLAVRSGYSPLGAVRMFETMDRLYGEYVTRARTPQEELSRVAIESLRGYFRSHPLPAERAARLRRIIREQGWPLIAERDLQVKGSKLASTR